MVRPFAALAASWLLIAGGCSDDDIDKLAQESKPKILVVDDDEGLAGTITWIDTLTAMGFSPDIEVVPLDGDPATNLDPYRIVIWTIGDQAFDNLQPANVTRLSAYLDNGGRLLYSGGHGVYSEPAAAGFIGAYLGLTATNLHMPTFLNSALPANATGQGHPIVGADTYTFWVWPGGAFQNMFSGMYIGLPTATGLLDHQPANLSNSGAPDYNGYLAAVNVTGSYKAVTWGFDINHLDPGDRQKLLAGTILFLAR